MKGQDTAWDKIFINQIYNKIISKELSKLKSKKPSNSIRKWLKDIRGHFIGDDIQMASNHMKRCLVSLAIT